jgi:hypothetical protein
MPGSDSLMNLRLRHDLGRLYQHQDRLNEAQDMFQRALAVITSLPQPLFAAPATCSNTKAS